MENTSADERDEFKYYRVYNERTNTVEKLRKKMTRFHQVFYPLSYWVLLVINIIIMGSYFGLRAAFTLTTNERG